MHHTLPLLQILRITCNACMHGHFSTANLIYHLTTMYVKDLFHLHVSYVVIDLCFDNTMAHQIQ